MLVDLTLATSNKEISFEASDVVRIETSNYVTKSGKECTNIRFKDNTSHTVIGKSKRIINLIKNNRS